jgi:hypothetical protein
MMLNIGAIKHCLELYRYHLCHEADYGVGDEQYREAMRTLKEIQLMLIERVAATHSRDQLVARIKDIKIQELKTRLKDKSLEDVIGDLLASGFYPLDDECETIMSEQVGMADHVILP